MFALAESAVELSLFAAVHLGQELLRAVPEAPEEGVSEVQIRRGLAGEPSAAQVRGHLPLAALAEYGIIAGLTGPSDLAADLSLTGQQAALTAGIETRTVGVLRCLVVKGGIDVPSPADIVLAGQVVWLLTDAGWVGIRSSPDDSGRQMVDLVPVSRQQIGSWLAPYLARILEAADDRS